VLRNDLRIGIQTGNVRNRAAATNPDLTTSAQVRGQFRTATSNVKQISPTISGSRLEPPVAPPRRPSRPDEGSLARVVPREGAPLTSSRRRPEPLLVWLPISWFGLRGPRRQAAPRVRRSCCRLGRTTWRSRRRSEVEDFALYDDPQPLELPSCLRHRPHLKEDVSTPRAQSGSGQTNSPNGITCCSMMVRSMVSFLSCLKAFTTCLSCLVLGALQDAANLVAGFDRGPDGRDEAGRATLWSTEEGDATFLDLERCSIGLPEWDLVSTAVRYSTLAPCRPRTTGTSHRPMGTTSWVAWLRDFAGHPRGSGYLLRRSACE
jgi:hypothetical protein